MANGHLTYKPGTGHLAFSVNGHLALNCGCSVCPPSSETCETCPSSFDVAWSDISGGWIACPPDGSCTITKLAGCSWEYDDVPTWHVWLDCQEGDGYYILHIERMGPDILMLANIPFDSECLCPVPGTYDLVGYNLCQYGTGTVVIS